jgi:hypothetical protein
MPRRKTEETAIELNHGHCADSLMSFYRIPREYRVELCHKIEEAFNGGTPFHGSIILEVMGYHCDNPKIPELKKYLESHQTRQPPKSLIEKL